MFCRKRHTWHWQAGCLPAIDVASQSIGNFFFFFKCTPPDLYTSLFSDHLKVIHELTEPFTLYTTHPILILNDVLPDRGQRCPFAVVGGPDCASFVGLEFTHCKREIPVISLASSNLEMLIWQSRFYHFSRKKYEVIKDARKRLP